MFVNGAGSAHSASSGGILPCLAWIHCYCGNVQGYIADPDDEFHVPSLAQYSSPGAVFDPNQTNPILPLVPIVVHVAIIYILNHIIYRRIASWLTSFENQEMPEHHQASLIIKRFLFEAFDCYVALFYLTFWKLDAMKVRMELQALFTADCARRIVTEVLLPWLMQNASAVSRRKEVPPRAPACHRAQDLACCSGVRV
jgi:hypothetical protein